MTAQPSRPVVRRSSMDLVLPNCSSMARSTWPERMSTGTLGR
jgi:hypothetical protein